MRHRWTNFNSVCWLLFAWEVQTCLANVGVICRVTCTIINPRPLRAINKDRTRSKWSAVLHVTKSCCTNRWQRGFETLYWKSNKSGDFVGSSNTRHPCQGTTKYGNYVRRNLYKTARVKVVSRGEEGSHRGSYPANTRHPLPSWSISRHLNFVRLKVILGAQHNLKKTPNLSIFNIRIIRY